MRQHVSRCYFDAFVITAGGIKLSLLLGGSSLRVGCHPERAFCAKDLLQSSQSYQEILLLNIHPAIALKAK
jgi:hypothetical protein